MNSDKELMQMALDAFQRYEIKTKDFDRFSDVIEALRARLAQPEPLPAKSKGALSHEENKQHNKKILDKFYEENAHLYTAPPQREWQGLRDEEILEEYRQSYGDEGNLTDVYFARAIEAKLKEKNT